MSLTRELIETVETKNELYNFNARDSMFQEVSRANYMVAGDSIQSFEGKLVNNKIFVQTGTYGNLVPSKLNTSITGVGDVTFKEANLVKDTKVINVALSGNVVVGADCTAIFTDVNFKENITVLGNAHFIGCVFLGGTITNTGTSYIIGCSNKSGLPHIGITATYGETN